ncbi:MAG: hypothetical protein WKF31_01435 [Thermoleophilaceae bacterium]
MRAGSGLGARSAPPSQPPPGEPGELRIQGQTNIEPGDIVAAGIGPGTPTGFLGRVNAVRDDGGGKVLTRQNLAKLSPAVVGALCCSEGRKVEVEGEIDFDVEPRLKAEWGFFRLKSASLTGDATASAEFEASAEATASCSVGPIELDSWTARPVQVYVGIYPVIISTGHGEAWRGGTVEAVARARRAGAS